MKTIAILFLVGCGGGSAVVEVPPPQQDLPPPPPPTAQVVVTAPAPFVRGGEDWIGRYTCAQGETDLDLHIDAVRGEQLEATFIFAHGPSNAAGSYKLRGSISPDGQVIFVPGPWLERPPNYVSVGMRGVVQGNTFRGRIDNASCSDFIVRRTN
jgi:hypothetical protein